MSYTNVDRIRKAEWHRSSPDDELFTTEMAYDPAGRVTTIHHYDASGTLARFDYTVDARGNRTQAFEAQRHPGSGTTIIDQSDGAVYYYGDWTTAGGFHVTEQPYASFRLTFAGNENVELTMGEGPDHGLYDVYIGGALWQSFNGYASSAGERVIPIPLSNDGPFTLHVNNRADKGSASAGHVMRFKQLSVDAEYTLQTLSYTYDAVSRVLGADYYPGENTATAPVQSFTFGYDIADNITNDNGVAKLYNKLNQRASGGILYDANGNMVGNGETFEYRWDRANRLINVDFFNGHYSANRYDGLGNRVSQEVDQSFEQYVLDLQPALTQVLSTSIYGGANTSYVHSPFGIHAAKSSLGGWTYMIEDGLGSVRGEIDATLAIGASGGYEPYGVPADVVGTFEQPFRFTGEMRDANALQYHRARYYAPAQGVWTAQDALETENRYNFANGNPVNQTDPSGYCAQPTQWWNPVDANCYYSAAGLARRYSAGDPEAYQRWFDEFITWPWANLKLLEGLASSVDVTGAARQFLENAAIIPSLLLHDPETTLLALQIVACQNNIGVLAGLVGSVGSGALPRPGVQPGLRVGPYVTVGLLGVLLAGLIVLPFAVPIGETRDDSSCNPDAFRAWWSRLSPPNPGGVSNQYERYAAQGPGTMGDSRRVPAGDRSIDADGADPNTCRLLEAKGASDPNRPAWRPGGYQEILRAVDDELRRYRVAVLHHSEVSALEIRTNSGISKQYFEGRLADIGFTLGYDGFSVLY